MKGCDQCQAMMINGVFCHETGCPNAWQCTKECAECGQDFTPETRWQQCCDDDCEAAYNGWIGDVDNIDAE